MLVKSTALRLSVAAWLVVGAAASPAAAQDFFVAGWDFGQYLGAGALSTDGATLSTSLPANYSDFDPTFGAGAESAAFGTMYNDGTNGSTMTTGAFVPYVPTSGSLSLNLTAPQNSRPALDVAFDADSVQNAEFPARPAPHQFLSMISLQPHMVVFSADLSSLQSPPTGTDWKLSFAGRTESTGTADVDVDFAAGAGGYTNTASVQFTSTEQLFEIDLGTSAEDVVYARLVFPSPLGAGEEPIIDNVAITVPEPGGAAPAVALLTVASLAHARRRRSRVARD